MKQVFNIGVLRGHGLAAECFCAVVAADQRFRLVGQAASFDELDRVRGVAALDAVIVLDDCADSVFRDLSAEVGRSEACCFLVAGHLRVFGRRIVAGRGRSGFDLNLDWPAADLMDMVVDRILGNDPPVTVLSRREQDVLVFLGRGYTAKDSAVKLDVSPRTVDACRRRIQNKLGLENPAELTKYCIARRLIDLDEFAAEQVVGRRAMGGVAVR